MIGFLANIGLSTIRSQIIAVSIIVVPLVIFGLAKMWQSDTQEKERLKIGKELSDERVDNLNKGKKVDDEIFTLDNDALCRAIGGCLPDDKAN